MKPSKKCAVDALCLLMMTVFSSSSSVVSHPAGNNSDRQTFVRRAKADKLSSRSRESKANHDKETHPLNNTSQDQIGFQIIEGTIIPKQNEEPSNLHQNQMEFQLEDQEEANAAQNEEKTGQSYENQSGYQQIFGSMSTMEEEVTVQVDGSLTGLAGIGSLAELVAGRKDDNTMDVPGSMLVRLENSSFSDGSSAMDLGKPNPRDISNAFAMDASILNSYGANDMMWAFGQFLNHDISQVNPNASEPCNITVPPDDPFLASNVTQIPMSRSNFTIDNKNVAQQLNDITSVIDASPVYGHTMTRLKYIRSDDSTKTGRLRTSGNNLLPKNIIGLSNRGGDDREDLFVAGDVRANENLALTVAHTLWLREHNYWADTILALDPSLDGDTVFEMARTIVVAEIQKITYDEFLPSLLGKDAIPLYDGYKPHINTGLENIVSSCAYRLGHTMVGPSLVQNYGNGTLDFLPLEQAFFMPLVIENNEGIDSLIRGLVTNVCQEIDPFLVPALRNHLFANQFDLMVLNIERGRDHGLPDFNTIRESLGLQKFSNFEDFLYSQNLASAYSNTDQIDCWIGMNSEPRVEGLMVGQTQMAILARNFANIRDGDENFYKHSLQSDASLLAMVEETAFSDVIRRNADLPGSLDDIQDDSFFV